MSASYQDHFVPSIKRSAARRTNAVIALHADDDDLGCFRDQIPQPGTCKRVVFLLVDDGFVWEWLEEELPTGCVWLVGFAGFAIIANVDDPRWMIFGACLGEDALDVLTNGVRCRYAAVFGVSKQIHLDVYDEEHTTGEIRWVFNGSHDKKKKKKKEKEKEKEKTRNPENLDSLANIYTNHTPARRT